MNPVEKNVKTLLPVKCRPERRTEVSFSIMIAALLAKIISWRPTGQKSVMVPQLTDDLQMDKKEEENNDESKNVCEVLLAHREDSNLEKSISNFKMDQNRSSAGERER